MSTTREDIIFCLREFTGTRVLFNLGDIRIYGRLVGVEPAKSSDVILIHINPYGVSCPSGEGCDPRSAGDHVHTFPIWVGEDEIN